MVTFTYDIRFNHSGYLCISCAFKKFCCTSRNVEEKTLDIHVNDIAVYFVSTPLFVSVKRNDLPLILFYVSHVNFNSMHFKTLRIVKLSIFVNKNNLSEIPYSSLDLQIGAWRGSNSKTNISRNNINLIIYLFFKVVHSKHFRIEKFQLSEDTNLGAFT